jgi:hypothetical protein
MMAFLLPGLLGQERFSCFNSYTIDSEPRLGTDLSSQIKGFGETRGSRSALVTVENRDGAMLLGLTRTLNASCISGSFGLLYCSYDCFSDFILVLFVILSVSPWLDESMTEFSVHEDASVICEQQTHSSESTQLFGSLGWN